MLSISKIFFSLLCIAHVSCALNFPNKHKTMKMTMEPLNLAEASEETIQEIRNELKKQAEAPEKTEEFSEKEIDEMEMVFESS